MSHGHPRRSPVVVGRRRELDLIAEALDRATHGAGSALALVGEAGIGKSRLAGEACVLAERQGGRALVGRAIDSDATSGLRPLREGLLAAARDGIRPDGPRSRAFAPVLSQLVPDWRDGDPAGPPDVLDVAEGVLRLLGDIGELGPVLFVIEDIQWADRDTVAVVEYLADHLGEVPALVLATIRTGVEAERSGLPGRLAARQHSTVVTLEGLTSEESLELACRCLGVATAPGAVPAALIERGGGLPFHVEALAAAWADQAESGEVDPADLLPMAATEAFTRRLRALSPGSVEILRRAAAIGQRFDWRWLGPVPTQPEVLAALREATAAHLLDHGDAGYAFRHALVRDAVLASMSPAEQQVAASEALAALRAHLGDLTGEAVELGADLAARAGDDVLAVELLGRLSRSSAATGSLAAAEDLLRRALTIAPPGAAHTSEIEVQLVEVLADVGRVDEATRVGEALLHRLAPTDDRAAVVELAVARAALGAGRWEEATRTATSVLDGQDDPQHEGAALGLLALAAMGRNDPDEALVHAAAALGIAEANGLWDVACEALEVMGRVRRLDDVAAAERAFQRAHDLAAAHGLRLRQISALHELGTIDLMESREPDRLLRARAEAEAVGSLATVGMLDLQLAAYFVERLEVDAALERAAMAVDAAERLGLSTLAMSHAVTALAHARRLDRVAMDASIERALTVEPPDPSAAPGCWGHARGMYHLLVDDLDAAIDAMDEGMALHREHPDMGLPFVGMWALARTLADRDGAAAREEIVAWRAQTPITRIHLALAEAVAAGRRGDLEEAEALFARADRALAERRGGEWMQHLSRRLVAEAALTDGWGAPVVWLRGALAYFESASLSLVAGACRRLLHGAGAPVPRQGRGSELVPPDLAAHGVTSRELDVLVLLGEDLTNSQIAARLHLSPRTVEKHVERLVAKTGRARRDLAALRYVPGSA